MDKYTPTTRAVRQRYSMQPHVGHLLEAEFDRWLAEHDRAAAERVWDSCAQEAWESELIGHKKRDRLMAKNPYRITEEDN